MSSILDMSNLRDIIDHDKELERELVSNFHTCYNICINELESSLAGMDNVLWRNAAHSLKGIAFNIGAEELGHLCLMAERNSEKPSQDKKLMLFEIKKSYRAVKKALDFIPDA